jgi:hypothetical protein
LEVLVDEATIKLNYAVTEEEMLDGLRTHDQHNSFSRWRRVKMGLLFLVGGAALTAITRSWLWIVCWPVLGLIFHWIEVRLTRRRQVKRLYSDPEFGQPCTIELDEEGVHIVSSRSDSRYSWSAFKALCETPTAFLLYTNPFNFMITPKRAFADEAQMSEFSEMVNRHIGQGGA